MAKSLLRLPLRCRRLLVMSLFLPSLIAPSLLYAQDLSVSTDDLRIELGPDGGFHLFIRHRPDISSVLITETTTDPYFREANFAYRAPEWNEINGNEIRLLDGVPIARESGIYSLVSSTPRWHSELGWVFHIYIPYRLLYGHEGGRQGEVHVSDGMYLNIRAFYYAFADYRGAFQDNPFMLQISQEFTRPPLEAAFLNETVTAFTNLAGEENTSFAINPSDMMDQIRNILMQAGNATTDIVICLDVSASMRPFFDEIREQLIPTVREFSTRFESVRVGMVFFRDFNDPVFHPNPYMVVPFTTNFTVLQRHIDTVRVGWGGDIPEAVYEGLFAGATRLAWAGETRIMILIGDAPPHPRPRGRIPITKQMVDAEIVRQGIELHAIILPHP